MDALIGVQCAKQRMFFVYSQECMALGLARCGVSLLLPDRKNLHRLAVSRSIAIGRRFFRNLPCWRR